MAGIATLTEKVFVCYEPQAVANNATLTQNVIDTQGYRYLRVEVFLGATDIALTACKLQEADAKTDANTLTSGADITGAVFGTSTNDAGSTSTLPSATDDNKVFTFEVDLRGRKRYILPVVTVGNGATGAYCTVVARLARGENTPTTAAQKGSAQLLRVPAL